jgi:hypothetical protein
MNEKSWTLSRYQVLGVVLYAAGFAILNLLGGVWTKVSMLVAAPFLPIGFLFGSLGAAIHAGDVGFLLGVAVGIALQSWVALCMLVWWRRRQRPA